MYKKLVSVIAMLLCTAFVLAGCGSNKAQNNTSASTGKDRVVIYTASEDERIAYIQEELDKQFPDTEIVLQSLGTGQLLSKLQAEGKNGDCDIFYDLEVVNAEIILNASPDLFVDLSDYDFSIYDPSVTGYTDRHHKYAVNGKTAGISGEPRCWRKKDCRSLRPYDDMLKPEYAGLISMPNPKSSGTGYSYYNGMITILGEEAGMKYFEDLNLTSRDTTSGSAPAKAAVRGDVAIASGLLWQCVNYANENEGMTVVVPEQGLAFNLSLWA